MTLARSSPKPFVATKCATNFCRERTTEHGHSAYCGKCRSRRWKEVNPLGYFFNALRTRARQRGKEFTLTFAEYCQFAQATDYARLKGKTKLSLSINRKDDSRGYSADNIEAITLSLNSRLRYVDMDPRLKAELMAQEAA